MSTRRTGFTLIELLVVIAIIAILAAILFPVFARARAKAQQTACLSNMKQITLGIIMYASDWNEKAPSTSACSAPGWPYADPFGCWIPNDARHYVWKIMPYVRNQQIFQCPSSPISEYGNACGTTHGYNAYSMNAVISDHNGAGGLSLDAIPDPADIILLTDAGVNQAGCNNEQPQGGPSYCCAFALNLAIVGATPVHNGGTNLGWADGHAAWAGDGTLWPHSYGMTPDVKPASFWDLWGPWTAVF